MFSVMANVEIVAAEEFSPTRKKGRENILCRYILEPKLGRKELKGNNVICHAMVNVEMNLA